MNGPYPEIMTVEQVAAYLQLSKITVYKYIREGRLPAARLGKAYRIRRADVEAFLERGMLAQSRRDERTFPTPWAQRAQVTKKPPVPSFSPQEEGSDPRRERPEIKDLAALTGNPMEWVIKGLN